MTRFKIPYLSQFASRHRIRCCFALLAYRLSFRSQACALLFEYRSQQILVYYSMLWRIETYFQQIKGHLGFEGVQVRSQRALLRYWLLNAFTFVFLCEMKKSPFTQTIHLVREQKFISLIEFVYVSTLQGGFV